MLKLTNLAGFGPGGDTSVNAVQFDGTGAFLMHESGKYSPSPVTSGQAVFSLWVKFSAGDGVFTALFADQAIVNQNQPNQRVQSVIIYRWSDNKLRIILRDNLGVNSWDVYSSGTITADGSWHHILISWDTNFIAGSRKLGIYIDDVSSFGTVDSEVGAAFTHDYSSDISIQIGDSSSGHYFNGAMAELYFQPGTYLDLSVTNNRRLFRTSGGHPAVLGSDGSIPTGTAPPLYLNQVASSFMNNQGYGGGLPNAFGGPGLRGGTLSPALTSP